MQRLPIHHVGYYVGDLEAAVAQAVETFGMGPFFRMEHAVFDSVTYEGEPAAYDHSSAFGQWGDIRVELTVAHACEPAPFRERMVTAPGTVGHVGILVDDVQAASAQLAADGAPHYSTGVIGPVVAYWHDATATLGHSIELLQRGPEIEGMYAALRAAADGWDGVTDPIRPMPHGG
jgi:catechol 2,3-dioxygenase-like lactoylglutathione lyase family enzyme